MYDKYDISLANETNCDNFWNSLSLDEKHLLISIYGLSNPTHILGAASMLKIKEGASTEEIMDFARSSPIMSIWYKAANHNLVQQCEETFDEYMDKFENWLKQQPRNTYDN